MAGVTVSSTSDSSEQVRAAAGLPPEEKPAEQLSLENAEHSEESQLQRERSENGNGNRAVPRGVEKKINKAHAEKMQALELAASLRERLARYETVEEIRFTPTQKKRWQENGTLRNLNGNGATPHVEAQPEALPEERQEPQPQIEAPAEHLKIRALREEYPDWDETFTRAQNENMRIADAAAEVMHASPDANHIAYFLAKNSELRDAINTMPESQQVQEIRKIEQGISAVRNGGKDFAERVKSSLSKEELAEARQAIKTNPLGAQIVFSTMRELNALPNGPEVFKALMSDPATCQRLAQMNQQMAGIELGRISARLENGNGHKPMPTVSKAPAPIAPLGGRNTSTVIPDAGETDYQTYRKLRDAGKVGMGTAERRRHGYV